MIQIIKKAFEIKIGYGWIILSPVLISVIIFTICLSRHPTSSNEKLKSVLKNSIKTGEEIQVNINRADSILKVIKYEK